MLKISNFLLIFLLIFCAVSCRCVPEGTPPEHAVEIHVSDVPGEKMTLAEAINLASTELAVKVFSKNKGEIKILFKDKPSERAAVLRLYQELKIFLPVKSVLKDEDFILESVFGVTSDKTRVWHLKLKDRGGRVVWHETYALKDGEKI